MLSVDEEAGGSDAALSRDGGLHAAGAGRGCADVHHRDRIRRGGEHPLEFWTTITGGFSSLGDEAEWRVRGEGAAAVPIALIVPLRANEHPDDPERVTPYRVIAQITPTEACVTHRLPGDTPDAEVAPPRRRVGRRPVPDVVFGAVMVCGKVLQEDQEP